MVDRIPENLKALEYHSSGPEAEFTEDGKATDADFGIASFEKGPHVWSFAGTQTPGDYGAVGISPFVNDPLGTKPEVQGDFPLIPEYDRDSIQPRVTPLQVASRTFGVSVPLQVFLVVIPFKNGASLVFEVDVFSEFDARVRDARYFWPSGTVDATPVTVRYIPGPARFEIEFEDQPGQVFEYGPKADRRPSSIERSLGMQPIMRLQLNSGQTDPDVMYRFWQFEEVDTAYDAAVIVDRAPSTPDGERVVWLNGVANPLMFPQYLLKRGLEGNAYYMYETDVSGDSQVGYPLVTVGPSGENGVRVMFFNTIRSPEEISLFYRQEADGQWRITATDVLPNRQSRRSSMPRSNGPGARFAGVVWKGEISMFDIGNPPYTYEVLLSGQDVPKVAVIQEGEWNWEAKLDHVEDMGYQVILVEERASIGLDERMRLRIAQNEIGKIQYELKRVFNGLRPTNSSGGVIHPSVEYVSIDITYDDLQAFTDELAELFPRERDQELYLAAWGVRVDYDHMSDAILQMETEDDDMSPPQTKVDGLHWLTSDGRFGLTNAEAAAGLNIPRELGTWLTKLARQHPERFAALSDHIATQGIDVFEAPERLMLELLYEERNLRDSTNHRPAAYQSLAFADHMVAETYSVSVRKVRQGQLAEHDRQAREASVERRRARAARYRSLMRAR